MKVTHTPRGFQLIDFKDHVDTDCSLQQSSVWLNRDEPGSSAIYLGENENRMYLELDQVKKLAAHLNSWIKTGHFIDKDTDDKT